MKDSNKGSSSTGSKIVAFFLSLLLTIPASIAVAYAYMTYLSYQPNNGYQVMFGGISAGVVLAPVIFFTLIFFFWPSPPQE